MKRVYQGNVCIINFKNNMNKQSIKNRTNFKLKRTGIKYAINKINISFYHFI